MPSEGKPIKVTVVDRRHHAHEDEAGVTGDDRSPYPSYVEELKSRTEAAEARAGEAVGRAELEIEAVRERLQRDVERRVDQGRSRLLREMLEVLDNLDRALAAATEAPAVARGIQLVRQQLQGILKQEGVEPIETMGQPYDPNVAEAVVVEQVEGGRDNLVLEEIQRGYLLGDTVLRPARVKVGKSSPA